MSRNEDFEIKDTRLLLQILSDDITRKDFLHAKVTVQAVMANEFNNIRNAAGGTSKSFKDALMTAIRRIERTDPVLAMETAAYIEKEAGGAHPNESTLRTAMGHKAINIASRVTKAPGATKDVFNRAREAINEVRNWTSDDVEAKASKAMTALMNRAEKRRIKM